MVANPHSEACAPKLSEWIVMGAMVGLADNGGMYPLDCDSSLLQRAYTGAAVFFARSSEQIFSTPPPIDLDPFIDALGFFTTEALVYLGTHATDADSSLLPDGQKT